MLTIKLTNFRMKLRVLAAAVLSQYTRVKDDRRQTDNIIIGLTITERYTMQLQLGVN